MIVRALPGTGKTTLTRQFPDRFVDSDQLTKDIFGSVATPELFERIDGSPDDRRKIVQAFEKAQKEGKIVLTNFYPERYGMKTDLHVTYRPDQYADHLSENGRSEMIGLFSRDVLTSWAESPLGADERVTVLEKGQFLSDAIVPYLAEMATN